MSAWLGAITVGSVSLLFPSSFSEFVDKFVIFYTVLAVVAIAIYLKELKSAKPEENKAYVFKKKSDVPLTFEQVQQKICGTWEKVSRKDFIDFLVWSGEMPKAARFIAG